MTRRIFGERWLRAASAVGTRASLALTLGSCATAGAAHHDWLCITGGAIGIGLPLAVGAAVAAPDRRVLCLESDGSAMYTIQGLFSAFQEQANVSFVILNNGAYAALTGFSAEFGMNHVPGCDLAGIDFVRLAKAQGVPAQLVDTVEAVDEALAWSFAQAGPTLLDVRIEYAVHSH